MQDFLPDDLGGNCDGLGSAFNPNINFVCCKENPAGSTIPPFPEVQSDDKIKGKMENWLRRKNHL